MPRRVEEQRVGAPPGGVVAHDLRWLLVGTEAELDRLRAAEDLAQLAAGVLERAAALAAQSLEQRAVAVEQVVAGARRGQLGGAWRCARERHSTIRAAAGAAVKASSPQWGRIAHLLGMATGLEPD